MFVSDNSKIISLHNKSTVAFIQVRVMPLCRLMNVDNNQKAKMGFQDYKGQFSPRKITAVNNINNIS